MHDPTEGGISTGLYEISESKNIGLLIDLKKLRFYKPVIKLCKIFNLNPLGIISSGCIIGIISKKYEKKLIDFCRKNKIKIEIIGKVIKEKGVFYKVNDKIEKLPKFQRDEINNLTF
jgi:hydrogenase maturation factor